MNLKILNPGQIGKGILIENDGWVNPKFEQNNYYSCTYSSQGSSIFLFMGEANGINFQLSWGVFQSNIGSFETAVHDDCVSNSPENLKITLKCWF